MTIDLEGGLARVLMAGTWLSVAVLGLGSVLAVIGREADGDGALSATVVGIGTVLVILTPIARVALAAVGFGRRGEREMTAVAVAVLAVLACSVVIGIGG